MPVRTPDNVPEGEKEMAQKVISNEQYENEKKID
jgi:hypothetical protein